MIECTVGTNVSACESAISETNEPRDRAVSSPPVRSVNKCDLLILHIDASNGNVLSAC